MSQWNHTSQTLPGLRDHVHFIVGRHRAWLAGTFEGDCFRSRWASYATTEVERWRRQDKEGSSAPRQPITPDQLYWSERPARNL